MSQIMPTEVRKRKKKYDISRENGADDQRTNPRTKLHGHKTDTSEGYPDNKTKGRFQIVEDFLSWINIIVGLLVMVILARNYMLHLKLLHENQMWFSNIKNMYDPVYFYIDTVFSLQGVMLAALYIMTWLLSGTWLAGLLMSAFLVFNREDITRVSMTIPLREHWSLPFFWIQVTVLTYYIKPNISIIKQKFCVFLMFLATFLFAITWQFNQFILLLQAMAMFGAWLLHIIPQNKVITVYIVEMIVMFVVSLLQFGNTLILTGLFISFLLAGLLIMFTEKRYLPLPTTGCCSNLSRVIIDGIIVLVLMKLINMILKALPPAVKELQELREFYDPDTVELMEWIESRLESHSYLCLWEPYESSAISPKVNHDWNQHIINIISWLHDNDDDDYADGNHDEIITAFYISCSVWLISLFFDDDNDGHDGGGCGDCYNNLHSQILSLRKATPQGAAFTGSMQLLAGVKLCTGRHITNHPHYEDKTLRLKTKQLYQMYGHRLPEDVHFILNKYEANYMILEDSICLSPRIGCRLPDIIDLDNGIIPKDGPAYPGLVSSDVPLFCDEIRYAKSTYSKFFKLLFSNKTFRVYKVL
ncbi:hypothetical protein LSH36_1558g00044 [Paralvinella palmiformis]|uniref:Uncharacterized protein n=1 Tax=Paralvinella palmiformis TaxID=53620 RepID=A0AAD9IT80_9ANNE|nr:hypothetical protein LSH36_1558g00044 [Paralvinella palmiformis]